MYRDLWRKVLSFHKSHGSEVRGYSIWEISANVNNICGLFTSHSLTNSNFIRLIVGCWCKSAVNGARSDNGSTQWQHWGPNWSSTPARTTGRIPVHWGCQTRIGYPWPQPATPDYYKQQQHSVGGSGWAERCFQLLFQWPRHNVRILANLISNVRSWMPLVKAD